MLLISTCICLDIQYAENLIANAALSTYANSVKLPSEIIMSTFVTVQRSTDDQKPS